jgi:hypothetical protein
MNWMGRHSVVVVLVVLAGAFLLIFLSRGEGITGLVTFSPQLEEADSGVNDQEDNDFLGLSGDNAGDGIVEGGFLGESSDPGVFIYGGSGGRGRSEKPLDDSSVQGNRGNELFSKISLAYPRGMAVLNEGLVHFEIDLRSFEKVKECDLLVNEEVRDTFLVDDTEIVYRNLSNVSVGKYNWKVSCKDLSNKTEESEESRFFVFRKSRYGGRTTDLDNVEDLSRVRSFVLENVGAGLIEFKEDVDLTKGIDFDSFVRIDKNFISIDSSAVPELNTPARLTFFEVDLENPVIFRDGEICNDCEIVSSGGDLVFDVQHFSSYTSSENSQLNISDTSDDSNVYLNEQMYFYANYSNVSSGEVIQGGGSYCNVTVDGSTFDMDYNVGSGLYEYNQSFSSAGVYSYQVSCYGTPLGFTNLDLGEDSLVSPSGSFSVRGAEVNAGESERAGSDGAGEDEAYAGNITSLGVYGDSITQSWQGYFGNVSGTIELAGADGSVLYNWSLASPEGEIYAAREDAISWTSVQCFNYTAVGNYSSESGGGGTSLYGKNLSQLESEFNIAGDDADGVDETFSLFGAGTHDLFYLGSNEFSEGECRSTRIFGDSGAGVNDEFEEVLLYDPVTQEVVFTSLLEEANVLGFDGSDKDFQMLVLEDGHGTDVGTTRYYFFVELE